MSAELLVGGVLVAVLLVSLAGALFRRSSSPDEHGVPAELVGADVAFAEKTFRSRQRRLVAKLDRAYRTPRGLVLVELKTRARDTVYEADVIELSVQRVALQDDVGMSVSEYAWVIVQHSVTGHRKPHRVRLMSIDQVEALSLRYRAACDGAFGGLHPASTPRQCQGCGHRVRCTGKFGDRAQI